VRKRGTHLAYVPPKGSVLDYKIPDYIYYPTKLLTRGTRDWARVRFLQACHRLGISQDLWPDFRSLSLPPKVHITKIPLPFTAPEINILEEGAVEWRKKANRAFQKHCDEFMGMIAGEIKDSLATGNLTRIKRPQGRAPVSLRFEWAALRYCLGKPYKDIATEKFNYLAIRQAVHRIYISAELEGVTKRGPHESSRHSGA
jgi:hypothetical protein